MTKSQLLVDIAGKAGGEVLATDSELEYVVLTEAWSSIATALG